MASNGTSNSSNGNGKPLTIATPSKPTSDGNSSTDRTSITVGNTILDKLLNQLSKDDREFILRLMTELGIPANDPMHPFLVALQYYVSILREIPSSMKSAADESVTKVADSYSTFQAKIDTSTTKIETEVEKIAGIRVQWGEDAKALLPDFKAAFDEAKETATAAYQAEIARIDEDSLQGFLEKMESARTTYLRDVLWQGWVWAGSVVVIASIAIGGSAYWFGTQHERNAIYKAFGGPAFYDYAKDLMARADNAKRLVKCGQEGNDKCTVWIQNPPKTH